MRRVGILGGGQLGTMLAESVQRLGARVRVFDPDPVAPATRQVVDVVTAPWHDRAALARFASGCDVLTCDTEHVPLAALCGAPWAGRFRPSLRAIAVAQHRVREKAFLAAAGMPLAAWRAGRGGVELSWAAEEFGFPCILKRATGGYDGHGQRLLRGSDDVEAARRDVGEWDEAWVLEEPVRLLAELSCIVVRGGGAATTFPILENAHRDHILDATVVPARLAPEVEDRARAMALHLATALDVEGLLTVEFFLGLRAGSESPALLVNELAPRPHNSGHVTRRACTLSQFDALARVLLDLPVPPPALLDGAYAMANLLGEVGPLDAAAAQPEVVELTLYGKRTSAPRRKMGHVITHAADVETALAAADAAREALRPGAAAVQRRSA